VKEISRAIVIAITAAFLTAGLSGCQKEGPFEKAGRKVDKAIEKTGEELEKAGQKVKDAVK
jgi:hypothetical protein